MEVFHIMEHLWKNTLIVWKFYILSYLKTRTKNIEGKYSKSQFVYIDGVMLLKEKYIQCIFWNSLEDKINLFYVFLAISVTLEESRKMLHEVKTIDMTPWKYFLLVYVFFVFCFCFCFVFVFCEMVLMD